MTLSQGLTLAASVAEDSIALLRLDFPLRTREALASLTSLAVNFSELSVRFESDMGECTLRWSGGGTWGADGDVGLLPHLEGREAADGYATDDVVRAWDAVPGLVVTASLSVDKRPWSEAAAAVSGATVWVGPSISGFERWLRELPAGAVLSALLARPCSMVLLRDWPGPLRACGPALTFGDLGDLGDRGPTAECPKKRAWPMDVAVWKVRSLDVKISEVPEELRPRLAGIVGWGAAALLSEEPDGETMRPDHRVASRWLTPSDAHAQPKGVEAVRELCEWVSSEPNLSRLLVARQIAASRIDDPLNGPVANAVVDAAEVAYRQLVDATVQEGLTKQLDLERTFQTIDSEIASLRTKLSETVDQTVLRAAAGILAIVATVSVSTGASDPLILWGAGLLIAYLLSVAAIQLRFARRDAIDRLQTFIEVLRSRGFGLDTAAVRKLNQWDSDLRRRIRTIRLGLVGACVFGVIITLLTIRP